MDLPISYTKTSDGTTNASQMTVTSLRAANATTIHVDTVAGVPTNFIASMGTPHTFTDPITGETITVISEATAVDFAGHIDTGNLIIDEIAPGYTDAGSKVGDIVVIRPTTRWGNLVAQSLTPTGMLAPFAGSSAPSSWLLCDGSAVSRTTYANLYSVIGTTFGSGDGSTTFNLPDLRGRSPVGVGANTWKFTFASTDVNTSTDQITVTANQNLITGRKIQLTTTGTLPTGLSLATDYYIVVVDSTHIKLATSLANAIAGTQIDITGTGSGTNTATHTGTTRARADQGGEESHAQSTTEMPVHNHSKASQFGQAAASGGFKDDTNWAMVSSGQGGTVNPTGNAGGSAAMNVMQPFLVLNYIIKT